MTVTNWARNVVFQAGQVRRPSSVDELRALVAGSDRVRALGTGHSFNELADTTGELVSVAGLPPVAEIDREAATVRVSAGTRYGELATILHAAGFGLRNLGSLPHISVGGACATGTHGSGRRNGNLATAVSGLELVTGTGDQLALDPADDRFAGAVVHLGALGVVTHLTLDLVPTFEVRQFVYDGLPAAAVADCFDEVLDAAYSVSLFTSWSGRGIDQVWVKSAGDGFAAPGRWHGAVAADGARHPIASMSPVNCTDQQGLAGPWHERLPHFRLDFTPSSGDELQSEFFVPRGRAVEAYAALSSIAPLIAPVLQISEIRTVAADELWLSPAYGRDSVAFHFTWIADAAAVAPVLAAVEAALSPFSPRPHWGKVFTLDPAQVRASYPRLPDFLALRTALDPHGRFRNSFTDRYLL
ncbi:putative xylitol oxidase [Catellatospora sp. TT07R-123]|uniref:FAD-binding protein n=1 Tax=Catellatospora sp. TT07R-123 TaxID=2733863 RepID=UPI001B15C3EE|nr:FAD-binding protein [Catellatospora sp. TT07R-123]GHJ48386.1 putative xylitol oxidase [Catellatospora sp. TT07R-123]